MSSLYHSKTERLQDNTPFLPLLFIGLYITVFILLIMLAFIPDYLNSKSFWTNGLFLLTVSIGGSFYYFFHHKYQLPLIFLLIILLLLATPFLWPAFTGAVSIQVIIRSQSQKLLILTMSLLLSTLLISTLLELSLIPIIEKLDWSNRKLWNERSIIFGNKQWSSRWKKWRIKLIILTASGAGLVAFCSARPLISSFAQTLFVVEIILFIILWIQGNYYYRRALWQINGLTPEPIMEGFWQKSSICIVTILFMLSLLLPGELRKIKNWWLIRALVHLFQSFDKGSSFKKGFHFEEKASPSLTLPEYFIFEEMSEPNFFSITITFSILILSTIVLLTSIFCLLFFIGHLLYKYIDSESKSLKGLPGLILKFYLYWRNLYKKWRNKRRPLKAKKTAAHYGKPIVDNRLPKKKRRIYSWGDGLRAAIRRNYYRLIRQGQKDGLNWHPSQTPKEIANNLTTLLPAEKGIITEITTDYHQARYAPAEPGYKMVQNFLKRVRLLIQRLRA